MFYFRFPFCVKNFLQSRLEGNIEPTKTKLRQAGMNKILKTLTIIVSTLSAVSLISNLFEIGLSGVALKLIEYYQLAATQAFTLNGLIELHPILIDFWSLSFIGATAYAKTPNIENARFLSFISQKRFNHKERLLIFVIFGFSMLGLTIIFFALNPSTYVDEVHKQPLDLFKGSSKNLAMITTALILFFILNAYAPSV